MNGGLPDHGCCLGKLSRPPNFLNVLPTIEKCANMSLIYI